MFFVTLNTLSLPRSNFGSLSKKSLWCFYFHNKFIFFIHSKCFPHSCSDLSSSINCV